MKLSIIPLIKWSTITLLLGKGFLHFTSAQPYYVLMSFDDIVSNLIGIILLITGILCFTKDRKKLPFLLVVCSILLLLQTFASYVHSGYLPEQFIEHSLQFSMPLVYASILKKPVVNIQQLYYLLCMLTSLTFIGHGLFALGFHHVPAHFLGMVNDSLHVNSEQSISFLYVIGVLDLVFAFLIFVPRVNYLAINYMIFWGFLTAFARVYHVLGEEFSVTYLTINFPSFVFRLLHGFIPLTLLILCNRMKNNLKISDLRLSV